MALLPCVAWIYLLGSNIFYFFRGFIDALIMPGVKQSVRLEYGLSAALTVFLPFLFFYWLLRGIYLWKQSVIHGLEARRRNTVFSPEEEEIEEKF